MGIVRADVTADPAPLPITGAQQSHGPMRRFAPCRGLPLLVPHPHFPPAAQAGGQRSCRHREPAPFDLNQPCHCSRDRHFRRAVWPRSPPREFDMPSAFCPARPACDSSTHWRRGCGVSIPRGFTRYSQRSAAGCRSERADCPRRGPLAASRRVMASAARALPFKSFMKWVIKLGILCLLLIRCFPAVRGKNRPVRRKLQILGGKTSFSIARLAAAPKSFVGAALCLLSCDCVHESCAPARPHPRPAD